MDRDEYQIVWTRLAVQSLADISAYIAADRSVAAEKVVSSIVRCVELLSTAPESGTAWPRGGSGRLREVVSGKYRVFYRIDQFRKLVEVLEVRHSARRDPSGQNW